MIWLSIWGENWDKLAGFTLKIYHLNLQCLPSSLTNPWLSCCISDKQVCGFGLEWLPNFGASSHPHFLKIFSLMGANNASLWYTWRPKRSPYIFGRPNLGSTSNKRRQWFAFWTFCCANLLPRNICAKFLKSHGTPCRNQNLPFQGEYSGKRMFLQYGQCIFSQNLLFKRWKHSKFANTYSLHSFQTNLAFVHPQLACNK